MNKRHRWDCINDRIKNIPSPVGVEVGVFRGECSGNLLRLHTGLILYMIDMWSPDTYAGKGEDAATEPYRKIYEKECDLNYGKALENVSEFEDRAIIIKKDSILSSKCFKNNFFDFVFIDAAHDYNSVKNDIIAWIYKIKTGGWIFVHDYGLFDGVTRAVDEMFKDFEIDDDYIAAVKL